jgi:SsrA-binding protein
MGIKIIAENRKARHEFHILETFEAGVVLRGSEIKSIRRNGCSIKESYVVFQGSELFMQQSHIPPYLASSYNNHEPERLRKLLLNKSEIDKIIAAVTEKGLSCVPLKVYFKKGFAKVEVAIVRGKKLHDKRESTKKRDVNRELARAIRKSK